MSYLSKKTMLGHDAESVVKADRLGWNLLLITWKGGKISLRLYRTDIITYYPDKKEIVLDSDGWIDSRLTREKFNEYLSRPPFYLDDTRIDKYKKKNGMFEYYLTTDENRSVFRDGIILKIKNFHNYHNYSEGKIINPIEDIDFYIENYIFTRYGLYHNYKNKPSTNINDLFYFSIIKDCKKCKEKISRKHLFEHLHIKQIPMKIFEEAVGKKWKLEYFAGKLTGNYKRFMRIVILRLRKYLRKNYG